MIHRFDASSRCNFVSSACVFNLSHVLSAFPLGDDDMIMERGARTGDRDPATVTAPLNASSYINSGEEQEKRDILS